MLIIVLVALGLILGSFVNALVWRTRQQELAQRQAANSKQQGHKFSILNSQFSILFGRSQCPNCSRPLAPIDLVPVLSWLALRGRCRYCHQKISLQYPLVEIGLATVFILSYVFWPLTLFGWQWVLFAAWLMVCTGLIALAVYDIRWMLLPNKILYPTAAAAALGRLIYIAGYEPDKLNAIGAWIITVALTSGIFALIYLASSGRAIGFGDVRLGFITGTVLADPLQGLLMIFLASVLGTFFVIPQLFSNKKTLSSKVPYGPFLILASFIVLLFGPNLINWYLRTVP